MRSSVDHGPGRSVRDGGQQSRVVGVSESRQRRRPVAADVRALAGGSVTERSIAEIVTTVEYIAKMQRNISESIDHLRTDGYVPDDDAELVGAIDRVMGLAAGLELASTEHLAPENEQLREQIHELNELLESARQVVWKKGHRRSRRGGTRPTIRSVVEGNVPYPSPSD